MKKIITLSKFINLRNTLFKNKKIVLVTGVFDILHIEHIRFLKKAKKQGNILLAGIDPDTAVKKSKGVERPIISQNYRAEFLSAVEFVDFVLILPGNLDTIKGREEFIQKIKPDVYAVSSSSSYLTEKRRVIEKFGGKMIIVHTHNPDISSTILLNILKNDIGK